jgi:hypothetical protein
MMGSCPRGVEFCRGSSLFAVHYGAPRSPFDDSAGDRESCPLGIGKPDAITHSNMTINALPIALVHPRA